MSVNVADPKRLTRLLSCAADGRNFPPEFQSRGPAHVVGVTGAAAAGKSTLTNQIIKALRSDNKSVVVLAIDPSDPESGGAFLGDRIRMRAHYLDEGVFIRSLSSRGSKDSSVPHLLNLVNVASHFAEIVLVESPGAGQMDLGIKDAADTFIFLPDIRADIVNLMKSGIHEHAHIMVLNLRGKADEEKRFSAMLNGLLREIKGWTQLVFGANALTGEGVEAVVRDGIYKHRDFLFRTS
ncbi:MAG: methylmalonyl Co-A mutase-associated GTPase MeaB [Candidatus Niyogibacteria bacterium]|nr:MAG: methylmalonyl Co-A mutase-associated GTPase MeaB [Candidatus Niyogibacteria bacterium]